MQPSTFFLSTFRAPAVASDNQTPTRKMYSETSGSTNKVKLFVLAERVMAGEKQFKKNSGVLLPKGNIHSAGPLHAWGLARQQLLG